MVDKQVVIQQIAQVFVNNVNNRLTVELMNGMIQEIAKLIPGQESNDNTTTTDSDVKE